MKTIDVPSSGKRGNTIASRNHYGPYVRRSARPAKRSAKRPTAAQGRARAEKRAVAEALQGLSEEQIQGWVKAAELEKCKSRLGKRYPLTWQAYFHRVNDPRAGFGRSVLMDPPPVAKLGPNPVGRLIVTNIGGQIALKLEVSGVPAADIMVFGAKPCRRTVLECFRCSRIGPLPAPEGGMSDITKQYVEKYGAPEAGQRVFIRTRQYVAGGHDEFLQTSAVVPGPQERGGAGKAG